MTSKILEGCIHPVTKSVLRRHGARVGAYVGTVVGTISGALMGWLLYSSNFPFGGERTGFSLDAVGMIFLSGAFLGFHGMAIGSTVGWLFVYLQTVRAVAGVGCARKSLVKENAMNGI